MRTRPLPLAPPHSPQTTPAAPAPSSDPDPVSAQLADDLRESLEASVVTLRAESAALVVARQRDAQHLADACKLADDLRTERDALRTALAAEREISRRAADEIRGLKARIDALIVERDTAIQGRDTEQKFARTATADMNRTIETLRAQVEHLTSDPARTGPSDWTPINKPFAELVERVIDPTRLAGLEVETEDGERYLIGDVNPGGMREHGQAFRRDAVIARARVRVRK